MLLRKLLAALVVTLAMTSAGVAGAITLDFEQFATGTVLSGSTVQGVTITTNNTRKPFDIAAIFDSRGSGTRDPDLEANSFLGGGTAWSNGNLGEDALGFDPDLGKILIIMRNDDGCSTGICSNPNDDGGGGHFGFAFATPITSFGVDVVDIDDGEQGGTIILHDGFNSVSFDFDELLPVGNFGNHSANRFEPLLAQDYGFDSFDRATIVLEGSGGVDNVTFAPIPEPGTVALLALGLLGLASGGRLRRPGDGPGS